MSKLTHFAARKAIAMSAAPRQFAAQRVQAKADVLSRGARAQASAELCNEAILRFIRLCYEHDSILDDFAHIESGTNRILITVPWRSHYWRWGLQATEAKVLARHIMDLQSGDVARRIPPVFVYAPEFSRWLLNIADHPILQSALNYWTRTELTAKRYVAVARSLREKRK